MAGDHSFLPTIAEPERLVSSPSSDSSSTDSEYSDQDPDEAESVEKTRAVLADLKENRNIDSEERWKTLDSFPPGYGFCPKDRHLIKSYLKKKVLNQQLPLNSIYDVDLSKHNPYDLARCCRAWSHRTWYFFTPRDRKYPNGQRPNRVAGDGYWKATGADKDIKRKNRVIGKRKALVFYRGKAMHGTKTNWIMHEYRIDDLVENTSTRTPTNMRLDDWVLCKIYKKRRNRNARENATIDSPERTSSQRPARTASEDDHLRGKPPCSEKPDVAMQYSTSTLQRPAPASSEHLRGKAPSNTDQKPNYVAMQYTTTNPSPQSLMDPAVLKYLTRSGNQNINQAPQFSTTTTSPFLHYPDCDFNMQVNDPIFSSLEGLGSSSNSTAFPNFGLSETRNFSSDDLNFFQDDGRSQQFGFLDSRNAGVHDHNYALWSYNDPPPAALGNPRVAPPPNGYDNMQCYQAPAPIKSFSPADTFSNPPDPITSQTHTSTRNLSNYIRK